MIASPIACESHIDRVVVYARGAVVTRRVSLPEGLSGDAIDLRVAGLTALVEAGSVRAHVDGDREITALQTRLSIPDAAVKPGELRERVRALDFERQRLEAEWSHRTSQRSELAGFALQPDLGRRASRRVDPAARVADALAVSALAGEELARIDGILTALDVALEENRRAREAAEVAAAQGSSAQIAGDQRASLDVVLRLASGGLLSSLSIEYVVAAARWWPAYAARFTVAATRVGLALDAFVAQASGEDWSRVKLSVSTADLAHDARLPELRSIRIGRAQPAPKRGYRSAPEGLDVMFEGYDRASAGALAPRTTTAPSAPVMRAKAEAPITVAGSLVDAFAGDGAPPTIAAQVMQEHARGAVMTRAPMPKPAMAMPQGMPMLAPARKSGGLMRALMPELGATLSETGMLAGHGGGAHAESAEPAEPEPIEPGDAWLDFDALRLGDPADRSRRGRLSRAEATRTAPSAASAKAAVDALASPAHAVDPRDDRGRFDHRYDAEGTCDVPSGVTSSSGVVTARAHRVAIARADASATPCFVAVPREAPEVYREVEIQNPFAAPLLSGPVEVFLDGALMTTSSLSFVDRGGALRLGLGVEDRLRVARNARVEEGSAGLLGGSTTVDHTVTIELASSLGRKVSVEVKDRIPVTDDRDIEIKLGASKPEPERYKQTERGAPLRRGVRWKIDVSPGEKAKIEYSYRVTLPAKNELVGGNRRE